MSDIMKQTQAKFAAVVVAAILAIVFAIGVTPASAYADDFSNTLSTTSVQVRFGDELNAVDIVNFSSTATAVTANVVPIQSGNVGTLFFKEGYRVVGANSYVKLQDVINAANGGVAYPNWTSVKFFVRNTKNGAYVYETYTKFNGNGVFPRVATSATSGLSESLPFYENTDSNDQAGHPDTSSAPTIDGAILALNGNSVAIASGATAGSTLAGMTMNTADAPRLMWGYDLVGGSEAGNRFPSNIVGIEVD